MTVGRNGSGKSNFFAAVQFVLSDSYSNLSSEDRANLIYSGATKVMSGYVSIVFDNSDQRFPTEKEEVTIRRTLGQKKDEFSLDNRSVTKSDIVNLLESAGFSRSNPYFIVPQGRITDLTNAKDSQRLYILKEVAGTQLYEQKRRESVKEMNDTNLKRSKIEDYLKLIDQRLSELEEEKQELRKYHESEREKRCLDYTVYNNELQEILRLLSATDDSRATELEIANGYQNDLESAEEKMLALENDITQLKNQIQIIENDKAQTDQDINDVVVSKAQLEMVLSEQRDDLQQAKAMKNMHSQDLELVESSINQKEQELEAISPQYESLKIREAEIKLQISNLESRQELLYAKQGRGAQFNTKSERDDWIKRETNEINEVVSQRSSSVQELEQDLGDLRNQLSKLKETTDFLKSESDHYSENIKDLKKQLVSSETLRDNLLDERKVLWRDERKCSLVMDQLKVKLTEAERAMTDTMSYTLSKGLQAARRIATKLQLDGVYGTVAELIAVDDKFRVAVEVTGGNSLFQLVVDTDETASRIIDELRRTNGGRVTILPLNRLKSRRFDYPNTLEAFPLVWKLSYDDKFTPAVMQIFGSTIVVRDMDVGIHYSHSTNLNSITLEGSKIDNKGVLSGGYFDPRMSRMEAVRAFRQARDQLKEQEAELVEIRRNVEEKSQEITVSLNSINQTKGRLQSISDAYSLQQHNLHSKLSEIDQFNELIETRERQFKSMNDDLNKQKAQLETLYAELNSTFTASLSESETKELQHLNSQINLLNKDLREIFSQCVGIEQTKSQLEVELKQNLRVRRDRLVSQISEGPDENALENSIRIKSDQLTQYEHSLTRLKDLDKDIVKELEELRNTLTEKEVAILNASNQRELSLANVDKYQKETERSATKRTTYTARKDELNKKIKELGPMPSGLEAYKDLELEEINRRQRQVKEVLDKFRHVNKRAVEQYNNFTMQREDLLLRSKELEESQKSIEGLITTLDQRKDESIERTFKQVAKAFTEIFQVIVPRGSAKLVMIKRMDSNPDEAEISTDAGFVDNYTGVGISVSFNSKHNEQQKIEQLSGGQKTLCALTLIFAIQQCDPAPFYLFDEIDANLDTQYRQAVAGMIHNLSRECQFICTTFRSEQVEVADKHLGVSFSNDTSSIETITKETALTFIENQQPS